MDEEKQAIEPLAYNDEIPDPEEEPAPRDDETEALRQAARHKLVPADEDAPNDCFSERML